MCAELGIGLVLRSVSINGGCTSANHVVWIGIQKITDAGVVELKSDVNCLWHSIG